MKIILTSSIVLLSSVFSLHAVGSAPDSLVDINAIHFTSPSEKLAFINYLSDSSSVKMLNVLLETGESANPQDLARYYTSVYAFIKKIKTEDLAGMPEKKKIKFIYTKVHDEFFRQYQNPVIFRKIFSDGLYNCVTASALFAIIFDELEIPFEIKESPEHVFLVAYPLSFNILVESTSPAQGYQTFDQRTQQNYVNFLRQNKLISEDMYRNRPVSDLFNEYYFAKTSIGMKQLTGLHYYNEGVDAASRNRYSEALDNFEKSYQLYPAERTHYLLWSCLADLISNSDYSDTSEVQYLIKATHFLQHEVTMENLQAEFQRITNFTLKNHSDINLYEQLYLYLRKHISNKAVMDEFSYQYYFERGRYFYSKGNYSGANESLAEAYALKPDNAEIQTIFVSTMFSSFESISEDAAMDKLEGYYKKFPQLSTNSNFMMIMANLYLDRFGMLYDIKDITRAEQCRASFEHIMNTNPAISVNNNTAGESYTAAALYYYKKGDKKKAKDILNQGLRYAPGNYAIQYRLNSMQ